MQPSFTTHEGASNRTPRRINSRLLLNIVRRRQPISRVDLARASGLQPSTVSLIVEDLIRSRWLLEGDAPKGARGRRPRMLRLSDQRCVIAVDIHPRQTTLALTEISGRIAWQIVVALPPEPSRAVNVLTRSIVKAIADNKNCEIEGIGICIPGRTDRQAQHLIFAPNLRWPIVSLKAKIEKATGLTVAMDNVANACVLSEVWFSEAPRAQDIVVVEVSEGLGTGLFINGAVARGEGGMAGEFGHIQQVHDGLPCNCGSRGCWETVASNNAALRFYAEAGGRHKHLDFAGLIRLALAGDVPASNALQRMAEHLGRGMRMIASAVAPVEIIVVGEITAAWHQIGHIVETELRQHPLGRSVRLRPAYDGSSARLRSAVALVFAGAFTP